MSFPRSSSSSSTNTAFLPVHVLSHDRDSGISTEAESDIAAAPDQLRPIATRPAYPFSDDDEAAPRPSMRSFEQSMYLDVSSNNSTTGAGDTKAGSSSSSSSNGSSPLFSSKSYHNYQAEQAMLAIKQLTKEETWKKTLKHKSGVMVYMHQSTKSSNNNSKMLDTKAPIFKGETVIHGFSPQAVFYVIGMRKLWDTQFDEGRLVENLNETTSITYEAYRPSAASKAYDVALVERIECSADGVIMFACTSIETPKLPKVPGRNRRQMKLQGWVLKPLHTSPPSTKVTFYTQESVKGWIAGLTKKSLARRPLIIAEVEQYLMQKAGRKPMSATASSLPEGQRRPSIMTPPVQQQQHSSSSSSSSPSRSQKKPVSILQSSSSHHLHPNSGISSNRPPRSSSLQSNESPATSRSSSMTRKIRFADDETSLRSSHNGSLTTTTTTPAASNESLVSNNEQPSNNNNNLLPHPLIQPSSRLYPPSRHRTARKQCLDTLKRLASSDLDEWKEIGQKNSAKLYSKSVQGSALSILRGDVVVNGTWTPEQVCSVIQSFGARKIWDEHFEMGQVVERFSQKEYLVYTQMRSMFPIHSRDFSLLNAIDSDPATGSIYVASASVSDNMIPEAKTHVRGRIFVYGWALHPIRRGKSSIGVQVTFVSHMELEGTAPLPPAIVRQLTMDVPSCVDRVQWYLRQHGCPPYIRRVAGKITHESFDSKDKSYRITLIAKHKPSHHHQQKQQKDAISLWCTDIRTHTSMYSCGFNVTTQPSQGVRVELRADDMGIRIYTEDDTMDGCAIEAAIIPNPPGSTPRYTCNGVSLKDEPVEEEEDEDEEEEFMETHQLLPPSPPTSTTPSVHFEDSPAIAPKDKEHSYKRRPEPVKTNWDDPPPWFQDANGRLATPSTPASAREFIRRRNSSVLVISDELSFTGPQLSIILLLMAVCYYMGKLSCRC